MTRLRSRDSWPAGNNEAAYFANPRISRMRSVSRSLCSPRARPPVPSSEGIYEERRGIRSGKIWSPEWDSTVFPAFSPALRVFFLPPRHSKSRKLPSPVTTCLAHKGKEEGEPTGFSSDTPDRSRRVCLALSFSLSRWTELLFTLLLLHVISLGSNLSRRFGL